MNDTNETTIVQAVTRLLNEIPSPDGDPYTYAELATRAKAQGHDLSAEMIRQMRNGQRTNPTLKTLQALAAAFGVSASQVLTAADPAEEVTATLRTTNLSSRDRWIVAQLIRALETNTGE